MPPGLQVGTLQISALNQYDVVERQMVQASRQKGHMHRMAEMAVGVMPRTNGPAPDPSERDAAPHVPAEDFRFDPAGTDFGDPDALADSVVAQLARDPVNGSLCGMLRGVPVEVIEACDRAYVHDVAEVALPHFRQDQARQLKETAEIDVNDLVEILLRGAENVPLDQRPLH